MFLKKNALIIIRILAYFCISTSLVGNNLFATSTDNKTQTVLFLGDSLTAGYGIDSSAAYPALINQLLQDEGYSVKVVNSSISGSTSSSTPSRMTWLLRTKPTILVLAIGANDGLRGQSLSNMRANIATTIEIAQANDIDILLAGIRIPPNYGVSYTNEFFTTYVSLAKEYKLNMIPFLLQDVAGVSSLNIEDGIHPNEEGHKIIAKTVIPYLKQLLN